MSADKAHIFSIAWRAYGGSNPPAYEPEYFFARPRKYRADFAFVEQKLLVEIDGGQWVAGGGRHNRDSDREKLNEAAVRGYRVLRFSTQMIENDPQKCVETVLRALGVEQ
jgi:very-short-patch-repair endonuclease